MSQSRQPKGIPVGGQFAQNAHDEAGSLSEQSAFDQIDWSLATDNDDPDSLIAPQRARLALLEDHILSRPHIADLGDGRVALFWHESGSENTLDRRPDREARAILDTEGNVHDFESRVGDGGYEPDEDFTSEVNADALRESNLPAEPTVSADEEGRPVYTGSRYVDGASAKQVSQSLRREIEKATKDGTLPDEFTYEVRGTDASGFGVVGVNIGIGTWKHGDNYGLIPGQSIYDQSPIRAAKVERAERVIEKLLESHDRKVVLAEDGTESQHAYALMHSIR